VGVGRGQEFGSPSGDPRCLQLREHRCRGESVRRRPWHGAASGLSYPRGSLSIVGLRGYKNAKRRVRGPGTTVEDDK
jgi:hypothetical protein